jgi:hypothetical protein
MTPWRIANKLRGECSYHTPIRVVLSTKKLSINVPVPGCTEPGTAESSRQEVMQYIMYTKGDHQGGVERVHVPAQSQAQRDHLDKRSCRTYCIHKVTTNSRGAKCTGTAPSTSGWFSRKIPFFSTSWRFGFKRSLQIVHIKSRNKNTVDQSP